MDLDTQYLGSNLRTYKKSAQPMLTFVKYVNSTVDLDQFKLA